jgi:hypothetical protein
MKYGEPEGTFESHFKDLVLNNRDFPDYLVPIALDPSCDFYCYSIAKETFGNIVCFDGEHYDVPERAVVFMARSLDEFLNGFIPLPDEEEG